MRVISGIAKRIPLIAPKGMDTRPTSDRAKEGLFNIIADKIPGVRFLDLFCGSGAVGIEALSRGATEVVFVDNARPAQTAVIENLEKTRLNQTDADIQIIGMSVPKAIQQLSDDKRCFDVIFLDPPYDMRGTNHLMQTLHELAQTDIIEADGLLIAETDTRTGKKLAESNPPSPFVQTDIRIYGQTCFIFYLLDARECASRRTDAAERSGIHSHGAKGFGDGVPIGMRK